MSDRSGLTSSRNEWSTVPVRAGRVPFLDALRVLGVFAVIVVHVASTGWASVPVQGLRWQTLNVFAGAARFATPLLVMISGYLFLDPGRPVTVRSLLSRRIPRIAMAFAFWSLLYAVMRVITEPATSEPVGDLLLTYFLTGHYHLWFLGVIAGLYLVTPFLRVIAVDARLTLYFLALAFVFGSVVPLSESLGFSVDSIVHPDRLQLFMVLGYPGYFLLGHYLGRSALTRRVTFAIYAAGVAGLLVTVVGTAWWSLASGQGQDQLYFRLNPHVALMSAAIFLAFRNHFPTPSLRIGHLLGQLGNRAFGIFLVHVLFLTFFREVLPFARIPALILVPVLSLVIFLLSWGSASLLSRLEFAQGRIV